MPIRRRIGLGSSPGSLMSTPSRVMYPSSIGSSRLTQRSNVLLPEPEAPIRATTEPLGHVEIDAVEDADGRRTP